MIKAEDNISIGCRFYPSGSYAPNILYFHGNGETAPDYDYVAPVYGERGINLFVADYRGYGMSDGSPTCSNTIEDAHPVFHGFSVFLHDRGYTGKLFVMGRSFVFSTVNSKTEGFLFNFHRRAGFLVLSP